ncbi:MAG: InlB B-repeat-containing protein, partial [Coriobacteriia bacterium]|nr:InlB B-repeat-containing protein [Coriobacteriia bacterium]
MIKRTVTKQAQIKLQNRRRSLKLLAIAMTVLLLADVAGMVLLTPLAEARTPSTRFTVSYNANGGRGTMANTTVTHGISTPLRRNTFTHSNPDMVFVGWHARRVNANGRNEWRYVSGAGAIRWIQQGATIPAGFARSLYRDQHSVSATTSLNNGQVTMFAQWAPSRF